MESKFKPIFAVSRIKILGPDTIEHGEVIKAFGTETEAFAYLRSEYKNLITQEELNAGWDLDIEETTIERLWNKINFKI